MGLHQLHRLSAGLQLRQRLFDLPQSSWEDYDTSLISEGGGVFARSAKSIRLSDEIKSLTGLSADEVTPDQLIHALLPKPARTSPLAILPWKAWAALGPQLPQMAPG